MTIQDAIDQLSDIGSELLTEINTLKTPEAINIADTLFQDIIKARDNALLSIEELGETMIILNSLTDEG